MSGAIRVCLVVTYFLAILSGNDITVSAKPSWKQLNPFTRSKEKCQTRCETRHGFYDDGSVDNKLLEPVSVGYLYAKVLCHCRVNYRLKNLIKKKISSWAAKRFSIQQFFYLGKQARKSYAAKGIKFVSNDEAKKWYKDMEETQINELLVKFRPDSRLKGPPPPPLETVIAELKKEGIPETSLNKAKKIWEETNSKRE